MPPEVLELAELPELARRTEPLQQHGLPGVQEQVPLRRFCTLELGGPARYFLTAADEPSVMQALHWAAQRGWPVAILGGGSNLVIADEGFAGLVLRMAQRGIALRQDGDRVLLTAQAGEPWDDLVAFSVARGLAGLECLSGIPGSCGATPIQNVGAYGQDVAETLSAVRVLDRQSLQISELSASACAFGYRDSRFKREPERFVVLAVTFALRPGGAATPRYAELVAALREHPGPATLGLVRDSVLSLRRRKSMVLDPADDNRRSVGSFFTNPVVSAQQAQGVVDRALGAGLVRDPAQVPRWPVAGGAVKLAAGWLIEQAGVSKGDRLGQVGLSSRHALALVHHGGGSAAELIELARRVRAAVRERFDITLEAEPVFLGFPRPPLDSA